MRKLFFFLLQTAFIALILITGCTKTEEPEPTPTDVIIAENVRILDASILAGMELLDTTTYVLNFSSWPMGIAAPKEGEIFVAGISESTPYGLLRKVTSVTTAGSGYTCSSESARLDEVILQGKIELHQFKLTPAMVKSMELNPGVSINKLKQTNLLGFDMSFEEDLDGSGKAKGYGSFYFEMGFNFDCSISIIDGVQFESSLDVVQEASLGVRASGNWSGTNLQLGSIRFSPWVIQVGPVPVVFVPKVKLMLKTDGGVSAELETYAWERLETKLGLGYDSRDNNPWTLINECTPQTDGQWPNLSSGANFNMKVGPEVSLKLYGQAGPFFDVMASSRLDATVVSKSTESQYNLNFELWLEANAGIDITLLSLFKYKESFNLFEKKVWELNLNGQPIPDGLRITSPNNNSFAMIGTTTPVTVMINGQPSGGVKIYVDDVLKTTLLQSPYTWNWSVTEPEGLHTIKAEAAFGSEVKTHSISVRVGLARWSELSVTGLKPWETINSLYFTDFNNGFAVGRGHVFQGDSWGFIVATSDGGKSWGKRFEVPNDFNGFNDVIIGGDGGFACGTGLGIWFTEDYGSTWVRMKDQYGEYVDGNLLRISSDGALVVAGEYLISVFAENKWLTYGNGEITIEPEISFGTSQPEITDMAFGEGGVGYFVGNSHYPTVAWVYRTTNSGFAWNQVATPGGADFLINSICVVTNNHLVITGQSLNDGAEIYYSNDGGNSWSKAQLPDYFTGPYYDLITLTDVTMVDDHFGCAVGSFGTSYTGSSIIVTTDGGQTWSAGDLEPLNPMYEMQKVVFLDKYHGWAGGYSYPNPTGGSNGTLMPSLFQFGIGTK